MNRREVISRIGLLLGGTIIGADAFISGCAPSDKQINILFKQSDIALFDEISETILPATATPGAKAAKVGDFMAMMVLDCYKETDQKVFIAGVKKLQDDFSKQYNTTFIKGTSEQRTAFLTVLDKEQKAYQATKKKDDSSHYFRMIKELTMLGFFTSEVGATKALRYVEVPGRFDGSAPYKKGDKAWAT
ncbi:MAG: gluconate 2-dehydrogenase subunit 3 family protein [Pedobacter sp.]|nr:gluconate 2-dehydrogenase subunit 3 family protein [Chitinophagaceae bacterium]